MFPKSVYIRNKTCPNNLTVILQKSLRNNVLYPKKTGNLIIEWNGWTQDIHCTMIKIWEHLVTNCCTDAV